MPEANLAEATTKALSETDSSRIGLALIPFTPVPLTGPDALLGWGRLALYGTLAYVTFNKMRPVSYVAMGALGVSLTTSLLGKAWSK